MSETADFAKPSAVERWFNRAFGFFVGMGLAPPDYYVLEVRGRTSGRTRSTPVNVIRMGDRRFLVAPRGMTEWVRNVGVTRELRLKRGRSRRPFRVRSVPNTEKAEILRAYLDRFQSTVQRYFPIPAGSPVAHFAPLAERYPVFELLDARLHDDRAFRDRER
jgi:deazaflavin-dependent oxidoreductase (nitroreductase family)